MCSLPATPEHDVNDHIPPRTWGLAQHVTGIIVAALTLVFLLLPAAVFLVAGVWAIGTYGYSLGHLWSAASDGQIDELGVRLDALSLAGHVLLASMGYFALVFALSVLVVGILGRERQNFLIACGVALALPSILGLSFGLQTALVAVSARLAIHAGYFTIMWVVVSMYVLVDAILVGMFLGNGHPQRGRMRWTAHPPASLLDSGPIAPMNITLAPDDAVPARERLSEDDETLAPTAPGTSALPESPSPDAPAAPTDATPPADEEYAT